MKKIVAVAAIATLTGSLFAVDVSFKMAARTQANLFNSEKKTDSADASKSTTTNSVFAMSSGSGSTKGFGAAKDDVQMTIKGDYYEASTKLVLNNDDDSVKLDTFYYGKLIFGSFNLTAGKFDSRWSARYNTKTTEIGLTDSTGGKFGINGVTWAKDVNNVSAIGATRVVSYVADYTFNDVGGGSLLLKAGAREQAAGFFGSDPTDKAELYAAPAFSVGYRMPDTIAVEGVASLYTATKTAFGLIAQPLMLPGKTLIGFTFAMNREDTGAKNGKYKLSDIKGNAFAIDFGTVQTDLVDNLTLVAQAKYEMYLPGENNVGTGTAAEKKNAMALYAYLALGYKVNDILTVALDGALEMGDLTDYNSKDDAANSFTIQPALQFVAGKGATLNTGFRFKKVLDDEKTGTAIQTIQVPLVLRVTL